MITNIITTTLTAYCSCKLCCGQQAKGIIASGKKPVQGITIAASRQIPFGAKVYLASDELHAYTVEDRLAKRFDARFDIYFNKHSDAIKFGIKTNQTVMVITKGNK